MPAGRPKIAQEWKAELDYNVRRVYEGAKRSAHAELAMSLTRAEFDLSRHTVRHILEAERKRRAVEQPFGIIGSPSPLCSASTCGVDDLAGGMTASTDEVAAILKRREVRGRGRPWKWARVAAKAKALIATGMTKRRACEAAAAALGFSFDMSAHRAIRRAWSSQKNN